MNCGRANGHEDANVIISDINVNDAVAAPYLVFKGAVKGDVLDASWIKEFYIYNGDNDSPITDINVDITDADEDKYAGSASHFKYTLELTRLILISRWVTWKKATTWMRTA